MYNTPDDVYLDLLTKILIEGEERQERTKVGTLSLFGTQMRFDLSKGFPLLTTKKVNFNAIIHELLWFLSGDTNIRYLNDNGVHIWDEWADENGDLGPVYGKQWRNFGPHKVDQIYRVVEEIKKDPFSRRHIVTAWDPFDSLYSALPPCHTLFQFYVSSDKKLSCQLYQRSGDIFLGIPFNIASYALLTHMVAHVCDLEVGEFVHSIGDAHLYKNHVNQALVQLRRKSQQYKSPHLTIMRQVKDIFDFKVEDFQFRGDLYRYHPYIKAEVAV